MKNLRNSKVDSSESCSCCGGSSNDPEAPESVKECRQCGKTGRKVKRLTLESLLTPDRVSVIVGDSWRFCSNKDCNVVYYSEDSGKQFDVCHLRVRVHQKSPGDPEVPVCYCFDHSPKSIADEIRETGNSTVIDHIKSSMKTPGCHCEDANPQGGCCLGNVAAVVTSLLKS